MLAIERLYTSLWRYDWLRWALQFCEAGIDLAMCLLAWIVVILSLFMILVCVIVGILPGLGLLLGVTICQAAKRRTGY
jgi:hypothetical protein